MTVLAMSHGELSRLDTLMRVERGEFRVEDAAGRLPCTLSYTASGVYIQARTACG